MAGSVRVSGYVLVVRGALEDFGAVVVRVSVVHGCFEFFLKPDFAIIS